MLIYYKMVLRDLAFIHVTIRESTKAIFAFAERHPHAVNSATARRRNVISFSSAIQGPVRNTAG
jgi:hypothetical protein